MDDGSSMPRQVSQLMHKDIKTRNQDVGQLPKEPAVNNPDSEVCLKATKQEPKEKNFV